MFIFLRNKHAGSHFYPKRVIKEDVTGKLRRYTRVHVQIHIGIHASNLVGMSHAKGELGRYRNKWEDNIKLVQRGQVL